MKMENKKMDITRPKQNLERLKKAREKEESSPNDSFPDPETEAQEDDHSPKDSPEIFFHWQALEYENLERSKKWYSVAIFIFVAIIGWAVYSKSIIMALVFLLAGIIGYVQLKKEPRIMDFMIINDGVVAGKEIYLFDNLNSFWIFYEPEGLKSISLHTKSSLMPYVHIPLNEEDPVEIRKFLLDYIPEKKHELGIADILGRLIGM